MFDLPETITYWRKSGNDGLGGFTWSAPVSAPGRIAYSQRKFTDINGDDKMSSAVCYTEAGIQTGDMVYFGETTSPTPLPDANDVRLSTNTPSGAGTLKKAWFA